MPRQVGADVPRLRKWQVLVGMGRYWVAAESSRRRQGSPTRAVTVSASIVIQAGRFRAIRTITKTVSYVLRRTSRL
jgi:hypothetical protein